MCTASEINFLENWYAQWNEKIPVSLSAEELAEDLQLISAKVAPLRRAAKVSRLWPSIAVAASILLLISAGVYFAFHKSNTEEEWIAKNFKNDIGPGSNSATLTLGNGKVVLLNMNASGRLALQGNIAVQKTRDGQLEYRVVNKADNEVMENTLTTRRKEQFKVVLADGTSIWLNAASSVKYPTQFNGRYREVTITGEAYFEVAHNAEKPFRVTAAGQVVEVLGTRFNVNSYADEADVRTTLLEGSVKVSYKDAFKVIKPGEQSILNAGKLTVDDTNTEEAVAWKNGYFRFNQENIEDIMRKLSRWYDIDVRFEGPISTEKYSGKISRFRNISEILKVFEYSGSIHFKIEGRRVTVLK